MRAHIEIDFDSGEVSLVSLTERHLFLDLAGNSDLPINFDELDLVDLPVRVSASSKFREINISEPAGLSFQETEAYASKIASVFRSLNSECFVGHPFNANFAWGEIIIRTEWGDGGYGVQIKIR